MPMDLFLVRRGLCNANKFLAR